MTNTPKKHPLLDHILHTYVVPQMILIAVLCCYVALISVLAVTAAAY
jgi:hypothetical protein